MDLQELIRELRRFGITNSDVIDAIVDTPRQVFVSPDLTDYAYEDQALPIDCGQSISQPYIVARMTELLLFGKPKSRVLEVGTGSGYQAAILSHLIPEVYTLERIEMLYHSASQRLKDLGYDNVHCKLGDGNEGWPEFAPYDGIMVTAATTEIPPALLEQLSEGGVLIVPIGTQQGQVLRVITREADKYKEENHEGVIFVPMLKGIEPE